MFLVQAYNAGVITFTYTKNVFTDKYTGLKTFDVLGSRHSLILLIDWMSIDRSRQEQR